LTWGILLGLGASLGWGVSGFLGGLQSRLTPSLLITFWSQLIGSVILLAAILFAGAPPAWGGIGWGMVAGLFGSSALVLFYRGMSIGLVSIVTPVASCGALVPVLLGLAQGQTITGRAGIGLALAFAGIVLVSLQTGASQGRTTHPRRALLYALGAALGFGLFFVFAARGTAIAQEAPLWVTAGARTGGLTLLFTTQLLLLRNGLPEWPGRHIIRLGLIGLIDTSATGLFTLATLAPNLGIVAVLASLYPVVTILLGRLLLAERLTPPQYGGIALALAGVALIAAP
jgi:drug/metabolite transporter (DMT)-like permease